MDLINVTEMPSKNSKGVYMITKCKNTNRFCIYKAAIEKMNLKHGDKISIGYDKSTSKFFLYKDEKGVEIYTISKNNCKRENKQLVFSSAAFADQICKFSEKCVIKIGETIIDTKSNITYYELCPVLSLPLLRG